MKNYRKYARQYFLPEESCRDWVKKDFIEKAPIWCSVDLRDGNQALVEPMDAATKTEFFYMLVELGFKEIEVGFPAASDTEFTFIRSLIDKNAIPDDVTIQVLTPAREKIIRRTFECVRGGKNVIIHMYNPVSPAQREQVFKKNKDEVKKLATDGAKLIKKLAEEERAAAFSEGRTPTAYRFEYTPESFSAAEPEFATEVCNAVLDVWKPDAKNKAIINLPATVELSMPHVFAEQVEYVKKHLSYPEATVLSVHTHNDRGCGVAASEEGVLAGAERVEGTLFGNGERTGNADIVTLALNLFTHGIDPELNLENLPYLASRYTFFTGLKLLYRYPYAGKLVFAAFSGSHQDAIAKGMKYREAHDDTPWNVPYLPIDPRDIGREYEKDVIRINSQSGKGGVGYILENMFALKLPARLKEEFSRIVKNVSDAEHKEIKPETLYQLFVGEFLNNDSCFSVKKISYRQDKETGNMQAEITVFDKRTNEERSTEAKGTGRLDAVSNALKKNLNIRYTMNDYAQHAISEGTSSKAITYISVYAGGESHWGVSVDDDMVRSSVNALCSAVNRYLSYLEKMKEAGLR